MSKIKTINVRMSIELYKQVEKLAKSNVRSLSSEAVVALNSHVMQELLAKKKVGG